MGVLFALPLLGAGRVGSRRPVRIELHVQLALASRQLIVLGLLLAAQRVPLNKNKRSWFRDKVKGTDWLSFFASAGTKRSDLADRPILLSQKTHHTQGGLRALPVTYPQQGEHASRCMHVSRGRLYGADSHEVSSGLGPWCVEAKLTAEHPLSAQFGTNRKPERAGAHRFSTSERQSRMGSKPFLLELLISLLVSTVQL